MTTISIPYSDRAVEVLQSAALQFTVNDPCAALNAEREYGKRLREGSLKYAAHLERMKCLTSTVEKSGSRDFKNEVVRPTSAISSTLDMKTSHSSPPASDLTQDQLDAVKLIVKLHGYAESDAIDAVRRVPDSDNPAEIWQAAMRFL